MKTSNAKRPVQGHPVPIEPDLWLPQLLVLAKGERPRTLVGTSEQQAIEFADQRRSGKKVFVVLPACRPRDANRAARRAERGFAWGAELPASCIVLFGPTPGPCRFEATAKGWRIGWEKPQRCSIATLDTSGIDAPQR
ncbi:hypothetical protein [Panacagrimonas perspica]|uniref:hypothetical protein n=1 Tax=Panacagrimonas perspica TaxID=381431 RepID=UPI00105FC245|nr:hypothetical protein [Panacagrimonas perspica]